MEKARTLLRNNQYPPTFYEPIIKKTLEKIVNAKEPTSVQENEEKLVFVEYRGKVSDQFKRSLQKCNVPAKVIFTLRKLKTCLPSLKPPVDKSLRSSVVYQICCPRCKACYVGQTGRHLLSRFKEHRRNSSPVGNHFSSCNCTVSIDDVTILAVSLKSVTHLITLEALWINEIKPSLNTKDEYKSRTLVIKI